VSVFSRPTLTARTRRWAAVTTVATTTAFLVLGSAPAAVAEPAPATPAPVAVPGRYIVTLAQKPLATYAGDVKGLPATRATGGQRLNTASTASKRYRDYLVRKQSEAAARVGVKPDRHYSVALNGFVAQLTSDQANRLAGAKGVLAVSKDVRRDLTDDRKSTDFLKLSGSSGVWAGLGGTSKAGRGVVVGVLDTGYWPENPSFAGSPLGTAAPTATDPYRPYKSAGQIVMKKADGGTFSGRCESGTYFPSTICNSKVISARYFARTFLEVNGPVVTNDYLSPRDGDGHGSHTASTAAGNLDVAAGVQGHSFGKISGVAPAAKLAVYKVGFTDNDGAEGIYNSDSLDAIDAAVTDGVDVINYSISGGDSLVDPVDLAFFSAASAGVFVAASGGNEGPGASTLNHVTPWLTTVAASTVQRYESTLALGNGASYAGVSTTVFGRVGPAPLVDSTKAKVATAPTTDANICAAGSLDAAKVAGKVVICQRGVTDRVAKSAEVKRAGGVGMVLLNPTVQDQDGDSHSVPTIHLNPPEATAVRAYANTKNPTATTTQANTTGKVSAYPQIASFSSRGPSVGTGGDLLKPDIAAPGVDTLAAVAPPSNDGNSYAFYSGTSMASPHVAGLAALYLGVHPTWSPMAVKSAMMTTASSLKKADGKVDTDRYAQGAGNVRPDLMLNPGVVFNSNELDWLGYLEGQGLDTGTGVAPIRGIDYNSPSIAIGKLVGQQTVTRRVTAVKPGVYRASISVPGMNATVSPAVMNFTQAGRTKTIRVTLSRKDAATGQAVFGTLVLTGAGTTARVPVAVTPQVVAAPVSVAGSGATGSVDYVITPGISGPFPLRTVGLAKGNDHTGTVTADGDSVVYSVPVPAGTDIARFALAADDPRSDIDLYVYRVVDGEPVAVAVSAGASGTEDVVIEDPEPGTYLAEVAPFSDPPGAGRTTYRLTDYALSPTTNLGDLTVTPANPVVTTGNPVPVAVSWSGLQADASYLGLVKYPDDSYTFVEVN